MSESPVFSAVAAIHAILDAILLQPPSTHATSSTLHPTTASVPPGPGPCSSPTCLSCLAWTSHRSTPPASPTAGVLWTLAHLCVRTLRGTGAQPSPEEKPHPTPPRAFSSDPLALAEAVLQRADDLIKAVPFREVTRATREVYEVGAVLKACCLAMRGMKGMEKKGAASVDRKRKRCVDDDGEPPNEEMRTNWPRDGIDAEFRRRSDSGPDSNAQNNETTSKDFEEAIRWLDMALIVSGCPSHKESVHTLIARLEALCDPLPHLVPPPPALGPDLPTRPGGGQPRQPVRILDAVPSLSGFAKLIPLPLTSDGTACETEPFVIKAGALDHWPALSTRPWATGVVSLPQPTAPDYPAETNGRIGRLRELLGRRWVPVEIGSKYTDNDWTQRIMRFDDFLVQHLGFRRADAPGDDDDEPAVGYLAQHDLFEQVPRLREDVAVPEYCQVKALFGPSAAELDHPEEAIVSAWLGPGGTVSPLHTDPHDNLFAQVIGRKLVVMYPPSETARLYPHEGEEASMLGNTARIDVEDPDLEEFPGFAEARGWECVVEEGDLLFIPGGGIIFGHSAPVSV
ncbi:Lysine-specific demethylase 8 [Phlyctochytrium bullatum]|nr:Lysine-specific demethylase 8 [Phlyctochytrium bullatum]